MTTVIEFYNVTVCSGVELQTKDVATVQISLSAQHRKGRRLVGIAILTPGRPVSFQVDALDFLNAMKLVMESSVG